MSSDYNMAYLFNSFVKWVCPFSRVGMVQLEKRAPVISNHEDAMNGETALAHIEEKIDTHIEQHNEDYKKLLWWIIAVLIGLLGSVAAWFISIGTIQEKVTQLESDNKDKVTRQELLSTILLIDEKFKNINEKLDDIKKGLNIR